MIGMKRICLKSNSEVKVDLFRELDTADSFPKELKTEITSAYTHLSKIENNFSNFFITTPYGKDWIKKQKISPDSFMQVVLQRTFYKLKKKIPKVYESAAIIMYKNSRTETIRPVNQATVEFCQKPSEKLLRESCKIMGKYKTDVILGKGADRHLFALYIMGRYLKQKFDLFENFPEIWQMDDLSTSGNSVSADIPLDSYPKAGAFGAQLEDGFGVAYFSSDAFAWTMPCSVSCYKSNEVSAEEFGLGIWETMIEMRELLEPGFDLGYRYEDLVQFK